MPTTSKTPTVLVIVPRHQRRDRITTALENAGLQPLFAINGSDAMKRIANNPVDCVLLKLPPTDMSTGDLIEIIRERGCQCPVITIGQIKNPADVVTAEIEAHISEGFNRPEAVIRAIKKNTARRRVEQSFDRNNRLTHHVRQLNTAVIEAETRIQIEWIAFNKLIQSGCYEFVLIGRKDSKSGTITPQVPITADADLRELINSFDTKSVSDPVDRAIEESIVTTGGVTRDQLNLQYAVVPVRTERAVMGVIVLYSIDPLAFDDAECDLLAGFGDWLGVIFDTFERGPSEDELNFANIIVHEIQNPLDIARGYVDLARENDNIEYLDQVEQAHERIQHILGAELGVLSEGSIEPDEITDRDLADTVEEAWETVPTRDAELKIEASMSVTADHDLLVQLFANLFDNAVTHAGSDVLVRVGILDNGFYIEDDGPGIPESDQPTVFERGYSTDAGSGLGLMIVNRIIEAHGWSISIIESQSGGARFEITGETIGLDDTE